jgi:ankyrin repeat protein
LEVLLDHGAHVNLHDAQGKTPLWTACEHKKIDCIVALLNSKANPNLPNLDGEVPLVASCRKNMCSAVAALLAANAQIQPMEHNLKQKDRDNTPVMMCCRVGHSVILNTLLTKCSKDGTLGLAVRQRTAEGLDPLLVSAMNNHVECVNVLANHGSDMMVTVEVHHTFLSGGNALHVAAHYGSLEVALTLLERGVQVNALDETGRSPLHIAVQQGHVLFVRLLKYYLISSLCHI